jgi:hypothetical protein
MKEGRSIEDALKEQAKAYREARKKMTEATQAAGEQRRLMDEYILGAVKPKSEPEKKFEPTTFAKDLGLDDCKISADIMRIIAPVLQPLAQEVVQLRDWKKQNEVMDAMDADHFDVVNSTDFREFAVNTYPAEILHKADSDPDLAKFIVNSFKKTRTAAATPVAEVKPVPKVATPVHTEQAKVPTGQKTYKRSDLRKLYTQDPETYRRMDKELAIAFSQGRVTDD